MRNTLLVFGLVAISFSSCEVASYYSATARYPNPFEFQQIDTLNDTKDEIFIKANEWIAEMSDSLRDVIQLNDKETGKIISKAIMESTSFDGMGRTLKF